MTATRSLMFLTTAEVVGDEDHREAVRLLEVLEQVQHLGLHADVERRHRLVADDQGRVEHERPGDRDALALAARRTGAAWLSPARVGSMPTSSSDLSTSFAALSLVPRFQIFSGSATMSRHLAARVQRRDRVLEDHLHAGAGGAHVASGQRGQLRPSNVTDAATSGGAAA